MRDFLVELPEMINLAFNALDVLVLRSGLLLLAVVGVVSILRGKR